MRDEAKKGSVLDTSVEHARLGPSSADGWFECAMYPTMTERHGDDDSSSFAAEEGTAAHELLEVCLVNIKPADAYLNEVFNKCPGYPDGFVADEEMVGYVQDTLDIIKYELDRMLEDDPDTVIYSERRVDPGRLFGRTDCWGTADVTLVNSEEIQVIDFKYGRGIFVPIDDKKQTILYLLGAIADLPVEAMMKLRRLKHAIIQPRFPEREGDIYRSQDIEVWEMPGWVESFRVTAAATDELIPGILPGEEQCRWCDGKAHCQAYAVDSVAAMFGAPAVIESSALEEHAMADPNDLTPAQVIAVLDNGDYILALIKAVRASVTKQLLDGMADPALQAAYKLVKGLGNASWTMSDEEIAKKLKNMKIPKADTVNEKLKSPTQIRKIAKSHLSEQRQKNLEKLIERKERAPSLVPNTDSRESVETTVVQTFGQPIKQ